ncbi:MAG TPA: hypothetical protein VF006_20330 [Longimicrobium sp.]
MSQMRNAWGMIEELLRQRARSLYDVHVSGYAVLGLLGWNATSAQGSADPWVLRSVVWGIVILLLSATVYEARSKRPRKTRVRPRTGGPRKQAGAGKRRCAGAASVPITCP